MSATSSSVRAAALPRGVIAAVAAVYALLATAAVLATSLAGGDAWAAFFAVAAATGATAVVTLLLLVPWARRLRRATFAAEALAAGRFDERAEVEDGEFGALASALNRAAERTGRLVDALRQERAQLEALLNASTDATVAIDRDGNVVYANDAARELFAGTGASAAGGLGRPFIEAVRDHDLNALLVAAAQLGERSVRVVAYGQQQRWLQATAVPIEGAGAWAALAVFHDLTEVRRLEGVRRDFISNVSHELRTPLAGIRAAAETLHEGALAEPDAAREFLGHIQRETDRMTQLVEELLELSRIESGAAPLSFAQLDAAALARDTAKRFARQAERAGLTLTADAPDAGVPVIGDAERLDRALGNLVANAIKFTPAGGSVTLRAADEGAHVAISVEDTGIGIEPEQQARVWERFYKADAGRARDYESSGGTGLGLAIVKHIVLAHGGTVALDSRPGRGSTFTLRLPRR